MIFSSHVSWTRRQPSWQISRISISKPNKNSISTKSTWAKAIHPNMRFTLSTFINLQPEKEKASNETMGGLPVQPKVISAEHLREELQDIQKSLEEIGSRVDALLDRTGELKQGIKDSENAIEL